MKYKRYNAFRSIDYGAFFRGNDLFTAIMTIVGFIVALPIILSAQAYIRRKEAEGTTPEERAQKVEKAKADLARAAMCAKMHSVPYTSTWTFVDENGVEHHGID